MQERRGVQRFYDNIFRLHSLLLSSPRMVGRIDIFQSVLGYVCIDLGRGNIRMAQKLLYHSQIRTVLK